MKINIPAEFYGAFRRSNHQQLEIEVRVFDLVSYGRRMLFKPARDESTLAGISSTKKEFLKTYPVSAPQSFCRYGPGAPGERIYIPREGEPGGFSSLIRPRR